MNIHEYQAKELFKKYGIPVPEGVTILDPKNIDSELNKLHSDVFVVKAQIHAGGRGKAGGVKVTKSREEALKIASQMFGMNLVTHQTGEKGQEVRRVYIESGAKIAKEFYLSLAIDTSQNTLAFIASTEGGVDIEAVAEHTPEKIIKVHINSDKLWAFHARRAGFALGFSGNALKAFIDIATKMYNLFIETDASQIEINPLVLTEDENLIALDAKINFDDNALFRHKEIAALIDKSEEDPLELKAKEYELSYVKMEGNIGCLVNGAGLAMATMDIIKYYGAEPANFLDVGGGATKERVAEAFKIILSDSNVKAILVNIFGGIMRCDIIAEGIIAAVKDVDINIPLVVRLAGTNFELGKKLLEQSGLKIIAADDLADAAQKVVKTIN